MSKLGDQPAFPGLVSTSAHFKTYQGMTLRQHVAATVLPALAGGMLCSSDSWARAREAAKLAVEAADALLAALEKQ